MPSDEQNTQQDNPLKQKGIITYNITNKQKEFLDSEAGSNARRELKKMDGDPMYNTRSKFTPLQNQALSFVDRHMKYLSEHPKLDPKHYLANIRLMTRLKR